MTPDQQELQSIQERKVQIRTELSAGPAINALNVDGLTVAFDRRGLLEELKYLEQREQELLRKNNRVRNIDLRNAF